MTNLSESLSSAELDFIDNFSSDRIDDEEDTTGRGEGIIGNHDDSH